MCGPKPTPDVPTPQVHAPEVPPSLQRIARLPVVDVAVSIYVKVKDSSPAPLRWGLSKAEGSAFYIVGRLDPILSMGLDVIESRAETTHRYVQEAIVKPVILRAGSVTEFSIKKANTCIDLADRYVDTYLPPIDKSESPNNPPAKDLSGPTMQAIHRADRLGRKLQRRLTERTLTEVRAFRHAGVEIIRWIGDMAKLLAKDPKAFYHRVKAGWNELSLPEPENQARPKTLEELIALLFRESVRRIVHITNKAIKITSNLSLRLKHFTQERIRQATNLFNHFYNYIQKLLEELACAIAGRKNQSSICNRPNKPFSTLINSGIHSSATSLISYAESSPPKTPKQTLAGKNNSRSGD